MTYEVPYDQPETLADGSFALFTVYPVNAFGWAEKWVNDGLRVKMVRELDEMGVKVYEVTACKV